MIDNIALLIPAYEPEEKMIPFLEELKDVFSTIVVVNDGSSSNEVFDKIPDGIKWKAYFLPFTLIVCPALFPPVHLMLASAFSER